MIEFRFRGKSSFLLSEVYVKKKMRSIELLCSILSHKERSLLGVELGYYCESGLIIVTAQFNDPA